MIFFKILQPFWNT